MRKTFLFAFAALALSACKDAKTEEKASEKKETKKKTAKS